jgi:hypothetical protein
MKNRVFRKLAFHFIETPVVMVRAPQSITAKHPKARLK